MDTAFYLPISQKHIHCVQFSICWPTRHRSEIHLYGDFKSARFIYLVHNFARITKCRIHCKGRICTKANEILYSPNIWKKVPKRAQVMRLQGNMSLLSNLCLSYGKSTRNCRFEVELQIHSVVQGKRTHGVWKGIVHRYTKFFV